MLWKTSIARTIFTTTRLTKINTITALQLSLYKVIRALEQFLNWIYYYPVKATYSMYKIPCRVLKENMYAKFMTSA